MPFAFYEPLPLFDFHYRNIWKRINFWGIRQAMNMKKFNQYFGGKYMRYWYGAFVLVMGWFLLNLFNNGSVNSYILTAYDTDGKSMGSMEVSVSSMSQPESLPVSKEYTPIKPVKFLK